MTIQKPTRARGKKIFDHEYLVTWNPTRRSWDVQRDTAATGGFAYDRDTAIGLAIREAQIETKAGKSVIVRGQRQGGETITEWP